MKQLRVNNPSSRFSLMEIVNTVYCVHVYVCECACGVFIFNIQSHLDKFIYWGWLRLYTGIFKSVYSEQGRKRKGRAEIKKKNWQQNSQEKSPATNKSTISLILKVRIFNPFSGLSADHHDGTAQLHLGYLFLVISSRTDNPFQSLQMVTMLGQILLEIYI